MNRTILPSLLVTLVAVGCAADARPTDDGQASSAVTGGSPDTTDRGVGIVWRPDVPELCTGVLIAPSVVLTAAHCVDDATTTSPISPDKVVFYTGNGRGGPPPSQTPHYDPSIDPTVAAHRVIDVKLATGFVINGAQNGCPNEHDAALLLLERADAFDGPKVPFATSAAQLPAVNGSARVIGYGTNDLGLIGTREAGVTLVTSVTAGKFGDAITTGTSAADPALGRAGDSGAPLLVNGVVVGIGMCHDPTVQSSPEWYTRIDAVASWATSQTQTWMEARAAQCESSCGAAEQSCLQTSTDSCSCIIGYSSCMSLCTGVPHAPPQCWHHWPFP